MKVLETRRTPFNVASTSADHPGDYLRMGGMARRIASNVSQRASYVLMGLRSSVRLDGATTDNSHEKSVAVNTDAKYINSVE